MSDNSRVTETVTNAGTVENGGTVESVSTIEPVEEVTEAAPTAEARISALESEVVELKAHYSALASAAFNAHVTASTDLAEHKGAFEKLLRVLNVNL